MIREGKLKESQFDWEYELARKLILSKIHQALGLDQIKQKAIGSISGGAPLNVETFMYFQSIDIIIHELYAMSESTSAQTTNMAGE
jgi:long-subunit acyl-CoA synthetase (AMP-forming)